MTITLVFLAVLLAFMLGWILSRSVNVKPWVADGGEAGNVREDVLPGFFTTPRVGLAMFMAVASSLFALTISAYHMRMEIGHDWRSVPLPILLWINTGVLVFASIALQWGWIAAQRANENSLRIGVYAGGFLAIAFVIGQLVVWRELQGGGYYLTTNPANAFFYMLTALHGAHLLGGLVAWARTAWRILKGATPEEVRVGIELCTIYWHYLLVIWIILFALLLRT